MHIYLLTIFTFAIYLLLPILCVYIYVIRGYVESPNTMTRSIVKYQFMANERARNTTLQKRKVSLFKKMIELKCLCDVDACLVMYEKDEVPPEVWPSPSEAQRVMQKFQNSKILGASAMLDQKAFLQKSIMKMKKDLDKEKEKNVKCSMLICLFDENDQEDLEGLKGSIESEIRLVDLMIKDAYEKGKEKMV
ncbi:agamous-like MADS-box protein AGL80 [Lactuca sativa]|uniref:agamous-like MADS-box protein AGL80 n=1 Tax=Lactuca sativa TaxID=4236 RepID=UPI0022AF6308|nr:agamous-like MADS-box protein AGL80 [Lactuca sativa]